MGSQPFDSQLRVCGTAVHAGAVASAHAQLAQLLRARSRGLLEEALALIDDAFVEAWEEGLLAFAAGFAGFGLALFRFER